MKNVLTGSLSEQQKTSSEDDATYTKRVKETVQIIQVV
jgi:hypothetical protein